MKILLLIIVTTLLVGCNQRALNQKDTSSINIKANDVDINIRAGEGIKLNIPVLKLDIIEN